ncbi:uncharacterized protein LOC142533379 [Primulina tabacum]|uniref:uncharacterized protein LOC142533379 n=1 Tax=Primulina tabacum TaxID=48773 RepID=UPI003F5AD149
MSEEIEERSLPELETPGLEQSSEQFPVFKQSNNKYTRAFLLEFCDAEFRGKLPPDFDLLTLRELDGASEDKIEGKRRSSNPSLWCPLPSKRWNFNLPAERWDCQTFVLSKGSQSQITFPSEKRDATFQPLLGQSGYQAGSLSPKCDQFQLRKSGNPYRPPHCLKIDNVKFHSNASLEETDLAKKKERFLEKSRSVTVEQCEAATADNFVLDKTEACVAQENSSKGSGATQIMGSFSVTDSSNRSSTAPPNNPPPSHLQTNSGCPTNIIEKTPQLLDYCSEHGMEVFMKPCFSTIENNQGDLVRCTTEDDSSEYEFPFSDVEIYLNSILGECEASWTNKGGEDNVELGIIKDNKCPSDDEWAEISQILQLERVYDHISNSKIENHSPENLDFNILYNSDEEANSGAEINLPDEDTLITNDDFIFPPLPTSSINCNCGEDDSSTSHLAANITENPEALNSSKHSFKVQPFLDAPRLVTWGKLHSLQHQSHDMLHSKMPYFHLGNDRVNFHHPLTSPTITRYLPPSPYHHTCSNAGPTSFHGTALRKPKANDSDVHYSQQPYICPQQHNQIKRPYVWNSSDKATFRGFG